MHAQISKFQLLLIIKTITINMKTKKIKYKIFMYCIFYYYLTLIQINQVLQVNKLLKFCIFFPRLAGLKQLKTIV